MTMPNDLRAALERAAEMKPEEKKCLRKLSAHFKAKYRECSKSERDDASWGYEYGVLITANEAHFIAQKIDWMLSIIDKEDEDSVTSHRQQERNSK